VAEAQGEFGKPEDVKSPPLEDDFQRILCASQMSNGRPKSFIRVIYDDVPCMITNTRRKAFGRNVNFPTLGNDISSFSKIFDDLDILNFNSQDSYFNVVHFIPSQQTPLTEAGTFSCTSYILRLTSKSSKSVSFI
jgi:hypothetical protein